MQKRTDASNGDSHEGCQSEAEEEEEPYYLWLWEIQRKKKNGTWSDEHVEKTYEDLQVVHQKELENYVVDKLNPQEAFTHVLKHRNGSHYQRGMV